MGNLPTIVGILPARAKARLQNGKKVSGFLRPPRVRGRAAKTEHLYSVSQRLPRACVGAMGKKNSFVTKELVGSAWAMTRAEAGKLGGRGKKADYKVNSFPNAGNRASYIAARLKRDHPELAEEVPVAWEQAVEVGSKREQILSRREKAKELDSAGMTQTQIASELGVSQQTISDDLLEKPLSNGKPGKPVSVRVNARQVYLPLDPKAAADRLVQKFGVLIKVRQLAKVPP